MGIASLKPHPTRCCFEKHLHRYLSEVDFRYSNRVALGIQDGKVQTFASRSRWCAMTVERVCVAHTPHAQIARRANLPHPDGYCHEPQIRPIIHTSRAH